MRTPTPNKTTNEAPTTTANAIHFSFIGAIRQIIDAPAVRRSDVAERVWSFVCQKCKSQRGAIGHLSSNSAPSSLASVATGMQSCSRPRLLLLWENPNGDSRAVLARL